MSEIREVSIKFGKHMADHVFKKRRGARVEIHISRADLAALMSAAHHAGTEDALQATVRVRTRHIEENES